MTNQEEKTIFLSERTISNDTAPTVRRRSYFGPESSAGASAGFSISKLSTENQRAREESWSPHNGDDENIAVTGLLATGDLEAEDPVTLPQSTHSLLFTECACSLPFWFAVTIAALSFWCLILALINNLGEGSTYNPLNIPVNVDPSVRGAQYAAIFIALLMEEEIPSGLYLLRKIPKESLKEKYPHIKYAKFVCSATIRIFLGYVFLLNVFLVVIQAEAVLDIFYDVLALQFVQQLDDISFSLAKMDVLGQRLKSATSQKYFRTEFDRQPFGRSRRCDTSLKGVYFVNSFLMLFGMIYFTIKQEKGEYQCTSITLTFDEDIWPEAVVTSPSGPSKKMVLVYSYFNGVYKQANYSHDGRPVYVEQNKHDSLEFNTTVGAELKYCSGEKSWVFTHKNLRKDDGLDESHCPWLLKSPETNNYNVLDVITGDWNIWTGVVKKGASLSIACNECEEDFDCNLHGSCESRECVCEQGHLGILCEHKRPCPFIKGIFNDTWIVATNDNMELFHVYGRPVYLLADGLQDMVGDNAAVVLTYTGSRYFAMLHRGVNITDLEFWKRYAKRFHSFWDEAFTNLTGVVSDRTTFSSPVGVDFYEIREKGEQYGPFGVLYPFQEPPGRGYFQCFEMNETEVELFFHPTNRRFLAKRNDLNKSILLSSIV